jgi:MFS family permease
MRRPLAAILAWQVTASTCYYAVFASTPFLRDAFALSRFQVGLVVTALTLGQMTFLFPAGAAVDGFGEGRVLFAGLLGLAAATLGIGLAGSLPAVGLAAFGLGFAYAVSMPGTNRAVFESIPVDRRNLGMGVKQVGVTAGSAISSVGIPILAVSRFGWQAGFLVAATLAVLVAVGFTTLYSGSEGSGGFELPSVGGVGGDASYLLLVVCGLFLGSALFVTSSYTILYLNEAVGVPVTLAGATLAGMQAAGSGGRVLFGELVDRLSVDDARSTSGLLFGQAVVVAVCVFGLAAVDGVLPTVGVSLVFGFFIFGFTGVYFSAIGAFVPDDEVGGASAAPQTALNVGALVAPPAFGLVADGPGYRVGWAVVGAVVILAALLLGRIHLTARRAEA